MPDTDVHLKYLLATALSTRKKMPPVLVINYHENETDNSGEADTRKRYKQALGEKIQYVNKRFCDATEDIVNFLASPV